MYVYVLYIYYIQYMLYIKRCFKELAHMLRRAISSKFLGQAGRVQRLEQDLIL